MSCRLVSGSTNCSDAAEHFQDNEHTVRYSPVEANDVRIRIAHLHAHIVLLDHINTVVEDVFRLFPGRFIEDTGQIAA